MRILSGLRPPAAADIKTMPSEATRKKRWLILTQYYPPEIGAASIRLRHIVRQLVANGLEARVVTALPNYPNGRIFPAYRGRLRHREQVDGVEVHRVWLYAATGRSAAMRLLNYFSFTVSACLAVLFGPKPDVLFVESRPSLGLAALLMKWLRGVPYIYNVADLHLDAGIGTGILRSKMLRSPAFNLENFFRRHAWKISTVTQGLAESIKEQGIPGSKISLLPNGADTSFLKPQPPCADFLEKWKLTDQKVFLYAGTFAYYHGLNTLIEAAALLKERPDVAFVLVGNGPERQRIEQMASRLGLSKVIFDQMPYEETSRLYSTAYATIATLIDMPVSERMRLAKIFPSLSCGVPIIYAGRGSTGFIEKHECGLIAPPEDSLRLADAISHLADDPELRNRMSQAGRRLAERDYDWATIVARWLAEISARQS